MKMNIQKSLHRVVVLAAPAIIAAICAGSAQAQPYSLKSSSGTSVMSGGPDIYTNIVTGGTPGSYDYLQVQDGSGNNVGPNGYVRIKYDASGGNTVYFYPGTSLDGWQPSQNRIGYVDPGTMTWEIAGDFTNPNWDSDPNAQMTTTGNGLYTLTYTIATAGTHQFKFRTHGTWGEANFGVNFANDSGNASLTTTNANQSVLIQLDTLNGRWAIGNPTPTVIVTNQVVFTVDMTADMLLGHFHPSTDQVFVSGSFNNWPGTGAGVLVLTNYPTLNGNTNLYYGTNTISNAGGSGYEYKFTTSSSGYEQIVVNRSFSLLATNGTLVLPTASFSDEQASYGDYLQTDTTVIFTINMTNATTIGDGHVFNPDTDQVYINGNFLDGGWTAWNNPIAFNQLVNNPPGSQIYQLSYVVPKGSPVRVDYKFMMGYDSVTNYDNEAVAYSDHFRYIRATATGTYTMPMDTFGNQYSEPEFGQLAATATNGAVSISWLGRTGVHLQTKSDLLGGTWQDIQMTDGTTWTTGQMSTNGFVSQTNYPATGLNFFRLVKP